MKPIEVGILGGTGMVGQHFIRFLQGHPWFQLTWLGASDRSAGKKLRDATAWRLEGDMPADSGRNRGQRFQTRECAAAALFRHGRIGGHRDRAGVCQRRAML